MEILLVRHAQPEWSVDGLSRDDPDLTDLGREQAARLANHLRGLDADRLIVSPLRRAQQTAEPLAEAIDLEPTTHDWLAEITAPAWEGTPVEAVEKAFRDSKARPLDEHWDGLPGGESFRDFHHRVTTGTEELLTSAGGSRQNQAPALWQLGRPDLRVVVVAHAGTNSVLLGHLLGVEPVPWEWERFVSFHSSVSTLRPVEVSGRHSFSLWRLADTAHLPADLQTV
jgi:probable phosphoglycerate mutase